MSGRRTVRALGTLALLAPLSCLGMLAAAPADAASGITAPGNGTVYTVDTNVHISATVDRNTGSAQLRMQSPGGSGPQTVATASTSLTAGASLSYDFDTATCASFPASCSGRAEALNGVWTVTLVSGSSVVDTSTFTLRIAPRAPRDFSARPDGYRAVVLSWTKGDEPDLTGWTVVADGSPTQDLGTDACSGSSCSATLTYAQDGTGDHHYVLIAHRRTAPGSDDTVDSPDSSEATATLDSPPPPPPPSPSDGGSTTTGGSTGTGSTGGTGGDTTGSSTGGTDGGTTDSGSSTTGGSSASGSSTGGTTGKTSAIGAGKAPATLAQRRAFALTFKAFAPKLGIPKLPPLPAAQGPSVAPLPDGTYEKTLGYQDQVKTEKVDSPQAAARKVTNVVGSALDSEQFLRFMAGALILMLLAAHARRWLASHDDE